MTRAERLKEFERRLARRAVKLAESKARKARLRAKRDSKIAEIRARKARRRAARERR